MACVGGIFAATGRAAVRYRWAVLGAWAAGTVLAMLLLPSLSSVTQGDNSSFLPASAPSEQAQALVAPLQGSATLTAVTVVVASSGASLSGADEAAAAVMAGRLARVSEVVSVRDAGVSADGAAIQFTVLASLTQNVGAAPAQQATLCSSLRAVLRSFPWPTGPAMTAHLAGPVATRVDNNAATGSSGAKVQWVSIIFVVGLLVAVFRSVLAPFVAVLPAVLVVLVASRLTAVVALHGGLAVSQIASLLLIVLVLGAGTDYALFLMFRVRELMRSGLACHEAITEAVARVGETIAFSAGVLIAALGSLAFATFGLYSGLAAPLSIGIGLMLLAGLTLLPALLAIIGPVAFWPAPVRPGSGRLGWWGRVCVRIVRRPVAVLCCGLVLFGALAVAAGGYVAAGFGGPVTAPAGSDSAAGDALLAAHFPATAVNPTLIVLRLRAPAWAVAAEVAAAEASLRADPLFTAVTGPLDPNGTTLSATAYAALYRQYGAPRAASAASAASAAGSSPAGRAYLASGSYVSADGRTIAFATVLASGNATTTAAARVVPAVRAAASRAASLTGALAYGVDGQPAFTYDIARLSDSDLRTVIPIAIAIIAVLLALVMRSLVAPLYLIASVVLSYFSALGLTVLVFIRVFGQNGMTFILPFLLFVFLLALGEDYNILVMTRIREEAAHLPLREAVSQALAVTGTTVSSAGLVLALTFGVLAVVGSGSAGAANVQTILDVGVGLALGVLMDTFLVRTLLVPSAVILIGRWNWWPSQASRASQLPALQLYRKRVIT
jgi:putative drug exporter of the RND superfamily